MDLFVHVANNNINCHSHSFYEFVYIVQGFTSHYYNNVKSILTPGDMFGIRPGDMHGYTSPRQTRLYNCLFHSEALGGEINEILKLPGIGRAFNENFPPVWQRVHFNPISRKEALGYLEKMKWERENRKIGWEVRMKSLLLELLVAFARTFDEQYRGEEKGGYQYTQYVYRAIGFMEENYRRTVQVREVADTVCLNHEYFSRIFKRFTGLSPMEYLKNIRIAKAAELLENPNVAIVHVAEETGFEDPAYFTRQFKNVLGVSPSQYQKTFKK